MKSSVDAWKENLKSKVDQLQAGLLEYFTNRDERVLSGVTKQLEGLNAMFGPNNVPNAVTNLANALLRHQGHKNHAHIFSELLRAYDALPSAASFTDPDPLSFDQIFDSYKADDALNSLVNELVKGSKGSVVDN